MNDFCFAYLNNVLIYSKSKEKHITHVRKILDKLLTADFYLNIDKCEFYVNEIKYLDLIIIIDDIKMNSKKIKIILEWKAFQNIKNVQAFLNFANFYRKFIFEYFKLIQSLTAITKINKKDFIFPWNSNDFEEKIFLSLKFAFIIVSILQHFNLDKKTWIEFDVSNWVIAAILFQKNSNGVLRSVIFMSQKIISIEYNYEIYDKKLLTIIKVFEKWRLECADTFFENFVKIIIDHKNLQHFMSTKQLNRRQARWTKFLVEFNFIVIYRPKSKNIKFDSLTRRSQNLSVNNFDERRQFNNQIILKNKNLDIKVRHAVKLNEKIHALEIVTTKLTIMAYPFLIKFITFEAPQSDNNNKNLNNEKADNSLSQPLTAEKQSNSSIPADNQSIFSLVVDSSTTAQQNSAVDSSTITQQEFVVDPSATTQQNSVIDSSTQNQSKDAQQNPAEFFDFLSRIKKTYQKNKRLQSIIKIKRNDDRKISTKLIKKDVRLKLNNCEIKFDFLWIKNRLHLSRNQKLQTDIIRHIHESSQKKHADRSIIYVRLNAHYYWQKMTFFVTRYIKTCHFCQKTKAYRKAKTELLKSLSISERYFQKIIVNFVIFLPICVRNDKKYQHIMMIVDRLFKTKKFAVLKSLNVDFMMQAFINWI